MTLPTDSNLSTLTAAGLTIESNTDIVTFLVSGYQSIYGKDINVASNSPDGQRIGIEAQCMSDLLELLADAYSACAVPTSYGQRLDQLVALNGLQRVTATYTIAQVAVTVTGAGSLPGLDQTASTPFTVADTGGNQYQLLTSQTPASAGTYTYSFQASDIGDVQTLPGTTTQIVTPYVIVASVNNPSISSDVIGINEETDSQLRVRHAQSLALASTGPSDSLEAALRNYTGITDAYVVENNTGTAFGTGQPAHSVWPIVNPNGATSAQIASVIYAKKAPGCALYGAQSAIVARPNGTSFTAQWDLAVSQPLHIAFGVLWIGPQILGNADVANALALALTYRLGQNPSIGDILVAMQTIAPTAVVQINTSGSQGVSSDNSHWGSTATPNSPLNFFTVSATNITVT